MLSTDAGRSRSTSASISTSTGSGLRAARSRTAALSPRSSSNAGITPWDDPAELVDRLVDAAAQRVPLVRPVGGDRQQDQPALQPVVQVLGEAPPLPVACFEQAQPGLPQLCAPGQQLDGEPLVVHGKGDDPARGAHLRVVGE